MTTRGAAISWDMIVDERVSLAADLRALAPEQWAAPSLCDRWSVQDVVAHLTAAATTGRWAWLRSIVGARFDPALHNDRRLAEHRGAGPAETLARFEAATQSRIAPTGDLWAWLGEVIVHQADIREPVGIATRPDPERVAAVAAGYVRKDFAVPSRTAARGLRWVATDSAFAAGDGPTVRGTTLDLVQAMAGRPTAVARLTGDGAALLAARASAD
ncbi:maleylpyruvate isomerase family mycothiol-dependent enzyme [Cellulomonas taurus]|uniref:maleylpyruvate isomerase family mycothiol-dependent enzyme n=1 Tax=Cellulomonas taurus TaxID=2729175 RepID=UPI00145E1A5F|nr:maleylpyruvate isomerase family mycothiol-dependent enzyme [Cellulomonas taurus]